ncbi:acyltransferase family protein [Sedimentibacter sp. zth1]|uniref:acyltransferase n=1 Tax=Sedimentibacter sp. zth1 TaxID=2816908 RepID=UPI001A9137A6|nr:acyltransferase family protein [Sedimentibacter sp. zth1]QSX04985.1 acyltransferase family protein [Sedimentibacter sp. zth1]
MNNNCGIEIVKQKSNILYLDMLRIFTIFTVIILHLSAQNWLGVSTKSFSFQVFNIYNTFVHCNVPVFIMLSGALLLDHSYNINIKKLYTKNILRLLIAYIFWSFLYAIITYIYNGQFNGAYGLLISIIKGTLNSHYHLWFLPLIIGIYMLLPIIKPLTESTHSKKLCLYFLILFFLLGILRPSIFVFSFPYKKQISTIINKFYFSPVVSWLGYLILGHYIKAYDLKRKHRILIYVLGIITYLFALIYNAYISYTTGIPNQFYYFAFSVTSFFLASTWFVFFKYQIPKFKFSKKTESIINKISKNAFGVYLVHAAIIKLLYTLGLNTLSFNPILSIPLIALLVYFISYLIVLGIRKIPFINKYII